MVPAKHSKAFSAIALVFFTTGLLTTTVRAQYRDDSDDACHQRSDRCDRERERERERERRKREREDKEKARERAAANRDWRGSIRLDGKIIIAGDFPSHFVSDVQRIAEQNGHRTGLEKGLDDGRHNRSFNPERSSSYRNGDAGYHKEFGLKEDYRVAYRNAFLTGYLEGFREYSNRDYVSRR